MRRTSLSLIVTVLVIVCMLLQIAPFGVAAQDENSLIPKDCEEQLVDQLSFMINFQKSPDDKNYVDEVTVLQPINSYECSNQKIVEIPVKTYPVLISDKLAYFAVITDTGNGDHSIQITECYVDVLGKDTTCYNNLTLVYDDSACYLIEFTSGEVRKIFIYPEIPERDSFDPTTMLNTIKNISEAQNDYKSGQEIHLSLCNTKGVRSAAQLYVPWVPQTGQHTCWAASVACIGNYLTSYWHSEQYIAQSVFGTDWDYPASIDVALGALYSEYIVSYPYYAYTSVPTDTRMYNNISNGYPVYSRWVYSGTGHACVIRGISTGSYVMVVDPAFGNTTAYKSNGTYSYYSSVYGYTLTMAGYGAKQS